MPLFRSMKVVHKLAAVTGILVVGFGGVGAAYFALQRTQGAVAAQSAVLQQFALTAEDASSKTLESENALKDYLLAPRPEALRQFANAINNANNATATLEKLAQNDRQQQIIYQLRDALSAYQRSAKDVEDITVTIGVNENSGIQGKFRTVAHELEEAVGEARERGKEKDAEYAAIVNLYLTMRRDEKDFLIRNKETYVARLAETMKQFDRTVQASPVSGAEKDQFLQLATAYHEGFLRLVDGVRQREQAVTTADQKTQEVEALVASLQKVTKQALEAQRQADSHGDDQRCDHA
jgi:CHASE3 domain sensor protein